MTQKYSLGYRDARIKLIKNEQNLGLTKSLNLAPNLPKEISPRLDSDDYCLPERLLKQWEFMQPMVTMSFVVPVIKRNMSQSCGLSLCNFLSTMRRLKNALSCFNPLAIRHFSLGKILFWWEDSTREWFMRKILIYLCDFQNWKIKKPQ